jgi:hypothetical protein
MSVRISIDKTITFCFAHIPTQYIIDQLPTPFIIMADFSGHNTLLDGTQ